MLGTTQPSSNPRSMMAHSMLLMPTGSSFIPRTHDPSQGAGQTLPVTSGKSFVAKSAKRASFHLFWKIKVFHLGMTFEMGHPVSLWQKGTPQSMQRADWYLSSSTSSRRESSFQSLTRVLGLRYFSPRRLR